MRGDSQTGQLNTHSMYSIEQPLYEGVSMRGDSQTGQLDPHSMYSIEQPRYERCLWGVTARLANWTQHVQHRATTLWGGVYEGWQSDWPIKALNSLCGRIWGVTVRLTESEQLIRTSLPLTWIKDYSENSTAGRGKCFSICFGEIPLTTSNIRVPPPSLQGFAKSRYPTI